MLKFLNKKAKLFVSYVPIEPLIYLKATNPERVNEVREDSVFPFFIKLLESPFEGWIIELVDNNENDVAGSFGSIISSIPKEIDDKQIKKLQKPLKSLLSKVIYDIINNN